MKRVRLAVAAISAMLTVAAAQAATLKVGIQDDPDALDPALSATYAGRFIFAAMCDKLVEISSPDLKIIPQLAESWQWASDGKAITFTLRHNVTFHDDAVRCRRGEVQHRAHEDHAGFQAQGRAGADRHGRRARPRQGQGSTCRIRSCRCWPISPTAPA